MLAADYFDEHPVVNAMILFGIVLTVVVVAVFHRPVGRALHAVVLWFMRAQGVADPEPDVAPAAAGVLWVDDRPEQNARLLGRLARDGVPVDMARGTDEALACLEERNYAIILSDMSRVEDDNTVLDAGLRLLARADSEIPFVIFSKYESVSTAFRDRALDEGAVAVVSGEDEVLEWLRAVDLIP